MRERLLAAAIEKLAASGPEALQARPLAAEIGASTMAVYTHFGGMPQLLDEVTREGFARFEAGLARVERSDDTIADLLALGIAYRQFALDNQQLYRLMFGLTTPGTRRTKERDLTTAGSPTSLSEGISAFNHLVGAVTRAAESGRIAAADPVAVAGQIWSATHGYVLLEMTGVFGHEGHGLVRTLQPLIINLLVGLGDTRANIEASLARVFATSRRYHHISAPQRGRPSDAGTTATS
ncbi:MAG: TetR family transcriptional regulator [Actinophytocola sp.]|nr:TetR family transcriptional regulator [Actinophytocola sp.]